MIGIDASEAVPISAKTGLNIEGVLEAIVQRLPPPKGDRDAPLKALLVNSWYDAYLGVVVLVRIVDGVLKKGMTIKMMGTGAAYGVDRIGVFSPKMTDVDRSRARRGRLPHRLDQGGGRYPRRRHDHRGAQARIGNRCRGSSRCSRSCSAASFPVDAAEFENLRAAMGQPAPQRRQLLLRDGDLRGARLRFPLRLSRAAAPRDHPGAAASGSSISTSSRRRRASSTGSS